MSLQKLCENWELLATKYKDAGAKKALLYCADELRKEIKFERKDSFANALVYNMTGAEKRVYKYLSMIEGLLFEPQKPIFGYIADFVCTSAKLVIEVDGSCHDGREKQDGERSKNLNRYGYSVLRVSNSDAERKIEEIITKVIDKTCRKGGKCWINRNIPTEIRQDAINGKINPNQMTYAEMVYFGFIDDKPFKEKIKRRMSK